MSAPLATSDDLKDRISFLRDEIEDLKQRNVTVPLYKNIPAVISVLAFLFSFGSTLVSYHRTNVQDMLGLRSELRSLLQRLAALPKENMDLAAKYSANASAAGYISGYINQENSLLARQAAEIARKLPPDQVSSVEYQSIALALLNALQNTEAVDLFKRAAEKADNLNDAVAAIRGHANSLFLVGRPKEGRQEYQRAVEIFSEYPGYNDFVKNSNRIWTELNWVGSEESAGAIDLANTHVKTAESVLVKLPPGQLTDQIRGQVLQARSRVDSEMQSPPH